MSKYTASPTLLLHPASASHCLTQLEGRQGGRVELSAGPGNIQGESRAEVRNIEEELKVTILILKKLLCNFYFSNLC